MGPDQSFQTIYEASHKVLELSNPLSIIKLTVELYAGLFQDSVHNPVRDWGSVSRFLIIAAVMIAISNYFQRVMTYTPVRTKQCGRCSVFNNSFSQLGRRAILARLIEAKTPIDLWYDVKVLSMRDGVQTKVDVIKNKRPRWRGFNDLASDEAAWHMRRIFEMGRTSVLREVKEKLGKGDKGKVDLEEWAEILRRCREEDMDEVERRAKPPGYVVQEREEEEEDAREQRGMPPQYDALQ